MSVSPLDQCRVVVLISGKGSNLQALINAQQAGELDINIVKVISNKPDAPGLKLAQKANIETQVIDHTQFNSRDEFDRELSAIIDSVNANLIVLAGFMRILTPKFVEHFTGRMLNIHPSLLPKYQGLNTHQRAIDAGDLHHGATVHFVTAELDGGPPIIQAIIDIDSSDNPNSLAEKVQRKEHQIYPIAVKWFAEGRIHIKDRQVLLDREPLPASGFQVDSRAK